MSQRARYNAQLGTTDTWTYAYNNGNEQTSMTLNSGTPETRTYDDWDRLAGRAQGTYSATYGYRYGGRTYSVLSSLRGATTVATKQPNHATRSAKRTARLLRRLAMTRFEANATLNYRADGRLYQRTQGSTTKTYRYDNRWNAILEETGTSTSGYIFVPGSAQELLGKTYGTLSATFAAYTYKDNIGSVRRWRLYNKTALQNIEFEPYGGIYSANNTTTPYDPIFALHPYDPAAQMYRAPYRMYDPDSTRWIRRDPLGMVDGPNMYAYVKGGVIGRWDEDGMCTVWLCSDGFHMWNIIDYNDDGKGGAYGFYSKQFRTNPNGSCCSSAFSPGQVINEERDDANIVNSLGGKFKCKPFKGSASDCYGVLDYWLRTKREPGRYNLALRNCRTVAHEGISQMGREGHWQPSPWIVF